MSNPPKHELNDFGDLEVGTALALIKSSSAAKKAVKGGSEMNGTITKKNFLQIWKYFGLKKAMQVILSNEKTALKILYR